MEPNYGVMRICLVFFIVLEGEPRASSNLALWPTSDFDPQEISKNYNIKTLSQKCWFQDLRF